MQQALSGAWDEEDMNGYQLLNQVGSGGTLSSLFTILSLFTDNVQMSWQDGERSDDFLGASRSPPPGQSPVCTRARRSNSDVSQLDLTSTPSRRPRAESVSSSGSTVQATNVTSPGRRSSSRDTGYTSIPSGDRRYSARISSGASAVTHGNYGVVARAAEDSTLAVIPAEAFQRLTKKFPKAAAHIVQGRCTVLHLTITD